MCADNVLVGRLDPAFLVLEGKKRCFFRGLAASEKTEKTAIFWLYVRE